LTKLYPGEPGEDEDDMLVDAGSFFNLFEKGPDESEVRTWAPPYYGRC
jgi:hypothetical protein